MGCFLKPIGAIIWEISGRFKYDDPILLDAGVKGQIPHLEIILRPCLLKSCFHNLNPPGAMIGEI